MSIDVTGPLSTPVNTGSTVQAGGDLDASTTYYWRVLAQDQNSTYFLKSNLLRSDWSVEDSFITTATDKQADLTWDAVSGATHYVVILTKVSGDYVGSHRCGPGTWTTTTATNSYTVDEDPSRSQYTWYMLVAATYPLPGGLDPELGGRLLVDFDGNVDLQDIYDQIVSDGYGAYAYYDGTTFVLNGSLYITDTGAGSLTVEGQTVILLGGYENASASGVTVTFGEAHASGYRNACTLVQLYMEANIYWYSNTIFYGGRIVSKMKGWGTVNGVFGDVRIYPNGCVFEQTALEDGANINMSTNDYIYRAKTPQMLIVGTGVKSWDMVGQTRTSYAIYPNSYTYGTHYRLRVNWVHANGEILAKSRLADDSGDCYMYDMECPYRSSNTPYMYWREYATNQNYWPVIYLYHSFVLRVVDNNGDGISGATVTIDDVEGVEQYSGTSNADGYLYGEDISITGRSFNEITDNSKSWTTNEHQGKEIMISGGVNAGMRKAIKSNTGNTITVHDDYNVACEVGDQAGIPMYILGKEITRDPETYGDGNLKSPNGDLVTQKTPHTVTISKAGYSTRVLKYTMDQKRNEVEKLTVDGTVLQDVVLYDAVIY